MNEILVLTLTRFGDLIQTTPLLRQLRSSHPHARITLAVNRRFSAILPLIKGVDRFVLFDQDGLARAISGTADPLVPYRQVEEFLQSFDGITYDLAINLTCNDLSAYLLSLIQVKKIAGISASGQGKRLISGRWAAYLFSVLLGNNRKMNRINLVDIFTRMGEETPDGEPVELEETEHGREFAGNFIEEHSLAGVKLVGIQMGASDSSRCWPPESFARLSDSLQMTSGVRTILFGSPGEREMADKAVSYMRIPPINAVGQTSVPELFSLVKRCDMLLTNDTGTMHFAAAGATPVVMLTIGPASFFCTGPYSAGNIALQPRLACAPCLYTRNCLNPVCRELLEVKPVLDACWFLLGEKTSAELDFSGVRAYQSAFGSDGFHGWNEFAEAGCEDESMARHYSDAWKIYLDGSVKAGGRSEGQRFPEVARLTARGMRLSDEILLAAKKAPLPLQRIAQLGDEEAAVETELRLLACRCPDAAPLIDFMTVLRENIAGEGLATLARETRRVYSEGSLLANML